MPIIRDVWHSARKLLWRITVGLALYVASCGPAVWLMEHGLVSERSLSVFYSPVMVVAAAVPPIYEFLDEYAIFWQRL